MDEPVEIASGVWWVGARLANDAFQCHAYLIENADESILIDPGSPLTIDATLEKVASIVDLDAIRYLVCHHPDPDIAASLPYLSSRLTRPEVKVVTEWRAKALLRHYGHRFDYYLVEEHDWALPLTDDRSLEFQLTPYLHFPGAMVSFDTQSATLFSSDLFGGFVPDSAVLVSDDLDYIIDSARPFHQHYMPSTELLTAGLNRIQHRWPGIARIAPQHGHIIAGPIVGAAFAALKGIDCGVFALADADVDLKRLLRISEARTRLTEALLTLADPGALATAMNVILASTHEVQGCGIFIELPDEGWTMWGHGQGRPVRRRPNPTWPTVPLPGAPAAVLSFHTRDDEHPDEDLMRMLQEMARAVRPALDQFLDKRREQRRATDARVAALTDPLTGLGNRRALEERTPVGDYSLVSLDLDHFKEVNDTLGHAAGDEVLARVADVLRTSVRDEDSAFRLGGEEFLVCLPSTPLETATAVAERIRVTVRELDLDDVAPGGRITVSVGVSDTRGAARPDFPDVLAIADAALYESKLAGRDRTTSRPGPVHALG